MTTGGVEVPAGRAYHPPRTTGYVLYSVGPNMKDDGGVEGMGNGPDDLVVEWKKQPE